MLLEGKVALVTGATRGIGKAIALMFAQQGADVAFTFRSSAAAAEQITQELESYGVKAKAFASDAASFEDAHQVVKQVVAEFGRVDVLVNNADRETNTIGSKCTDVRLARIVVDMKAELEKIREQTQNIE